MGGPKSTGKTAGAPDEASVHFDRGVELRREDRLGDAEDAFRRALDIRPDFPEALNNLGVVLRLTGRHDEAEAVCRRALELRPGYVAALYNLARCHRFRPGDPLIAELERWLRPQKKDAQARSHLLVALGKAHDDVGDYEQAFSYYARANREAGRGLRYDAAAHSARVKALKTVFPEPAFCHGRAPGPLTPIFVVGMPRSGKSLVESLLAQNPGVIALGEGRDLQQALDEILLARKIVAPLPDCIRSLGPIDIRAIGARYLELLQRRRSLPGTRFYVNTLPGNYSWIGLIFQAFPNVRVIHCTRDPLDLCLFTYFKIFTTGHEYSFDLRNLAAYFRNFRDMMDHWQRLYGDRILTVNYEDMVRAPDESARRLYEYCGLGTPQAGLGSRLNTDQIGHARYYASQLAPLREALGQLK